MHRFLDRSSPGWSKPDDPTQVKPDTRRFSLRDYLEPGGAFPYDDLIADLESAISHGWKVILYSVPGFTMLTGSPGWGDLSWSNGNGEYFPSAEEAMMN